MSEPIPFSPPADASEHAAVTVGITNGDGFAWNDVIDGVVTLHAGAEPATCSVVSVGIVTQDVDGFMSPVSFAGMRDPHSLLLGVPIPTETGEVVGSPVLAEHSIGEVVIARDVSVAPGTTVELAFQLPVPSTIALGDMCFVSARAESAQGVDADRHDALPFVLLPPSAIQALQAGVRAFGDFTSIEVSATPGETAGERRFVLDYVAPTALQDRLDGFRWEVTETADIVSGMAVINPQERSVSDHLRSFVHADRVRIPVTFDRAELVAATKAGTVAASVIERLHELLSPFLNPVTP